MKRNIEERLIRWKNEVTPKPLMVLGARQVGKTYTINEFCKNNFQNFISVNLLDSDEIIDLYNEDYNADEKYQKLKLILNFDIEKDDTCLFIDEIQESEKLISQLKYFCEFHPNVRIICAGSLLGVKLKRNKSSFPVGKVTMIYMHPMTFYEFLEANNEDMLINEIEKCYQNNTAMLNSLHHKALELYKIYLCTGGMPESVNNIVNSELDITKYDKEILNNILESYFNDMNKYIISKNEGLKIERIYNSIPTQLGNVSNKFQYTKITSNGKKRDYETALDWLYASNLVLKSLSVRLPEIPLAGFANEETFKLYLNDVGLLTRILKVDYNDIILEKMKIYKGIIAENYVACQLFSCSDLYYWRSDNTSEVDFLLYKDSNIIPIEVKGADNVKSKSLDIYRNKYKPVYSIRISTKNFGYDKDKNIKSVPLYAVFCIK